MQSQNEITAELHSISKIVAEVPKKNIFEVPGNYFDEIVGVCLSLAKIDRIPSAYSNDIPPGYFEALPALIINRIHREENENLTFASAPNPFTVPDYYFNKLPDDVLSKVKRGNIFTIGHFFRYAAAAVVTGIMGLTVFSKLNNKEITATVNHVAMAEAKRIIHNNSFEQELQNIDDEAIIDYLSVNGHDIKAALVADATENSELPSSDDYLLDEETLDKFLSANNIKQYN